MKLVIALVFALSAIVAPQASFAASKCPSQKLAFAQAGKKLSAALATQRRAVASLANLERRFENTDAALNRKIDANTATLARYEAAFKGGIIGGLIGGILGGRYNVNGQIMSASRLNSQIRSYKRKIEGFKNQLSRAQATFATQKARLETNVANADAAVAAARALADRTQAALEVCLGS